MSTPRQYTPEEVAAMIDALRATEGELVCSMAYLSPMFRKNYQAVLDVVRKALEPTRKPNPLPVSSPAGQ